MVNENIHADTLYRQNRVETEQFAYTVRNFVYLIGQGVSLGKIRTLTSLNMAANAETAGTLIS
jgi:hypothetical protein